LTAIINAISTVANSMTNFNKAMDNKTPFTPGGTSRDNFYSRYAGMGFTPQTGASSPVTFNAYLDGKQIASSISKPVANNVRANTGTRTGGR
jgi:hypothetical protein